VGSAVAEETCFYSGASRIQANYLLVPQKSLRLLKKFEFSPSKFSYQPLFLFLFSYSTFLSNLRLNSVK
jgi:hypothetical protein